MRVWQWLSAIVSILAAFLYALLQVEKRRAAEKAKIAAELAEEQAQLGVEALVTGLDHETRKELIDVVKRSDFE